MNGSMGLGVTATSKNPDLAWSYVVHMTSQPTQNAYAKLSLQSGPRHMRILLSSRDRKSWLGQPKLAWR
jgi:ABC-type glycerol-3-phosphate transport system substrate-binding protein